MSAPLVLVVGAGHAGLEAAFAASRVGARVLVITGRLDTIGQTPCNPSVGGVAKGHLVAEIEALGGFMGRAADRTAIHGRVLNRSKGPAVQAVRVQVDKQAYGELATESLLSSSGILTRAGLVHEVIVQGGRARGVVLADGSRVAADAVVITTGTFLGGVLHTGGTKTPGGRMGEAPATGLASFLKSEGFSLRRLKTGTPPRVHRDSIDWERLDVQDGEDPVPRFALPGEDPIEHMRQVPCHLTWTNPRTHDLVQRHLHESPMYSGQIEGRGPRYCPSLEDKVVRFAHRDRHQVFLEPEGLQSDLVYPNGISTSLPAPVQEAFVRTIAGLERAQLVRPGYAVEYDALDARALRHTLASKDWVGLYFAGQINGTSGYEEAGGQGLVAGANAALWALERRPLVVSRRQGYVGVMIDDLVTQGCDEPYRMFTSRAEYRIVLRMDNADERLEDAAFAAGLIDGPRHERGLLRRAKVDAAHEDLLAGRAGAQPAFAVERARVRQIYAGYLDKQEKEIARMRGDATVDLPIPDDFEYAGLSGLTTEAAQRLARVRPTSTGQAARIPGMTPAALTCLWAHVRKLGYAAKASRPA